MGVDSGGQHLYRGHLQLSRSEGNARRHHQHRGGNGLVPFPSDVGDEGLATNAGLGALGCGSGSGREPLHQRLAGHRIRKVFVNGFITSIAGNGIAAYSGDGGPATSSRINSPRGIALDALGNVYFADTGNHRIRKINAPPEGPPVIRLANPVVPSFIGGLDFLQYVRGDLRVQFCAEHEDCRGSGFQRRERADDIEWSQRHGKQ